MNHDYYNVVECLVSLFTIENGKVKLLLMRKKTDPYKGYWILPSDIVTAHESLEECANRVLDMKAGLEGVYMEQCHTFSNPDRDPDTRIIATAYVGLIDSKSIELKKEDRPNFETQWFAINDIPKMGYDHEEIISQTIDYIRKKMVNSNVLKSLFPSDFTLPELQKVYEQLLFKTFDRRNFRKKFINLGLIEDTGDCSVGGNGRPAKLYRFKEEITERDLF